MSITKPTYYHMHKGMTPFDIIREYKLDPWRAFAIKYLLRAGNKVATCNVDCASIAKAYIEDLAKCITCLDYAIDLKEKEIKFKDQPFLNHIDVWEVDENEDEDEGDDEDERQSLRDEYNELYPCGVCLHEFVCKFKCRQKKHEPCDNFEDNGVYDDDM